MPRTVRNVTTTNVAPDGADVAEARAVTINQVTNQDSPPPGWPPQLLPVWGHLMQRRKDGSFRHPTVIELDDANATTVERQRIAIVTLYAAACMFANTLTPSRQDVETMRAAARMLRMAEQFGTLHEILLSTVDAEVVRKAAENLRRLTDVEYNVGDANILAKAANVVEAMVNRLERVAVPIERDHGMGRRRFIAIHLARTCTALFGKPLLGVVTKLIEAIFECKIEPYRVRDWIKLAREE